MHRFIILGAFVLAGALMVLSPAPASALIRYVAVNGVDSATCGTLIAPCRSITAAIGRAVAGDKIVVGPGRYGDIDRDGAVTTPGDEKSKLCSTCAVGGTVLIDKAVTVESSGGAAVTIIEPATQPDAPAIWVKAAGVTLGGPSKGFTLRATGGSSSLAIYVAIYVDSNAANVTVQDNVITAAEGSAVGLYGSGAIVTGNVVSGTQYGVIVNAPTASVTSNVFESNATGIFVINNHSGPASSAVIEANYIVGNAKYGVSTQNVPVTVTRNVLASNGEAGVLVSTAGATLITSNNFTANGVGGNRCGVTTFADAPVNAEKNYWGSAQGPGTGNADTTCKVSTINAPVDATPFLTKAVVITNTTGR